MQRQKNGAEKNILQQNSQSEKNTNTVLFFSHEIPEEIVVYILTFLLPDELILVMKINRALNRIANDDLFWSPFFKIHFFHELPLSIFPKPHYKTLFFNSAKNQYKHRQTDVTYFSTDAGSSYQPFSKTERELFHLAKSNSSRLKEFIDQLKISDPNNWINILNTADVNDYTVLMWAMALQHKNAKATLESYGEAKINASKESILFAAKHAHVSVLEATLKARPSLATTAKTENDHTIFHVAAIYGHVAVFELCITKFPTLLQTLILLPPSINPAPHQKSPPTPFYLAVEHGQLNLVEYLLKLTDGKPTTSDIHTALNTLLMQENPSEQSISMVKLILQYGNLSDQQLGFSMTYCNIFYLKLFSQLTTVNYLQPITLDDNENTSPLEKALFYGEQVRVVEFKKQWSNINRLAIQKCYLNTIDLIQLQHDDNFTIQQFFTRMLNPSDDVIDLSDLRLATVSLINMRHYFIFLLDRLHVNTLCPIKMLNLSNTNLGNPYALFLNQPSYAGYKEICQLIEMNLQIEALDLSNTNLDDVVIHAICEALKKNTYLKEIKIENNSQLSGHAVEKLEKTLKNRQSLEPVPKKAKLEN